MTEKTCSVKRPPLGALPTLVPASTLRTRPLTSAMALRTIPRIAITSRALSIESDAAASRYHVPSNRDRAASALSPPRAAAARAALARATVSCVLLLVAHCFTTLPLRNWP